MSKNNNQKNISTLSFFGGAESVTGANFLLEDTGGETKILIDCGFTQGGKISEDINREDFGYDPSAIDFLFVTHAHIDHIGRIPKLVRDGFRGVIYSTTPTMEIAEIMFSDSIDILRREAKRDNLPPIYEKKDVENTMKLWKTLPYHSDLDIGGGFSVSLKDAGHILGSAMFYIKRNNRTIVFTGDLGNSPAPLLRDTEILGDTNYLVMESVYGDRNHEDKKQRKDLLEDIIEKTIARGGALMIPAFSLERTQDLLYEINNLVEKDKIPSVPIFLDSPLAIKVTKIYKHSSEYFNKDATMAIKSGDDIFNFPRLSFTLRREESMAIKDTPNPKIIMAGSGMSNGGRIIHHEKRYLPDPNSTLLIIGYQAIGSLGRRIQEGAKKVTILGERIPVLARIEKITGYSAHKDSDGLVDFVQGGNDKLEKVFVAMGEPKSAMFLAQRLKDYVGVKAVVPKKGDSVNIDL